MTAPTWLRIRWLELRIRFLFERMGLDPDSGRRADAWRQIIRLHDERDSLRAERDAR